MHTHTFNQSHSVEFAYDVILHSTTNCMLLVCSMRAFGRSLWVPWWLTLRYCGLAALVDSVWRKDCTCQCVNTTLLQPCMPRRGQSPTASRLQFQCSGMESPWFVPQCHRDDTHIHVLLYVQRRRRRYLQRQDYVAPHLCTYACTERTDLLFRHQGYKPAPHRPVKAVVHSAH